MLLIMGWLQQAVPQRLCNAYLISDQRALGLGFVVLAAGLPASVLLFAWTKPGTAVGGIAR
jgi:hypothetical protein